MTDIINPIQEIPGELVPVLTDEWIQVLIKKSDPYPDLWCLVHDTTKVIVLVLPEGKTWTGKNRVMLVGTEKQLRDEIKRLNLGASVLEVT